MLYIRDMGMATYNLLNFKMRPVMRHPTDFREEITTELKSN